MSCDLIVERHGGAVQCVSSLPGEALLRSTVLQATNGQGIYKSLVVAITLSAWQVLVRTPLGMSL